MSDAPHGAICARLLPFVMEANVKALQSRAADSPVLNRFTELAKLLTGNSNATTMNGVEWIQSLCAKLDVPPLASYGMTRADIPAVVEKAQNASSMKGNPIELDEEELTNILVAAL
jgi:alcohol dehydrogenase class IV